MSLTQIDAVLRLARDPVTILPVRTEQALRHRGLVDENGRLNELGRQAASELRAGPPKKRRKETTRIHLENEPATLAQLRLLESLSGWRPSDVSKHDASLLISFVKEQKRAASPATRKRLTAAAALIEAGAQAADAVAFSDPGPFRGQGGTMLEGTLSTIRQHRGKVEVILAVRAPSGASVESKPTRLRRRGDVPVTASRARALFEELAQKLG